MTVPPDSPEPLNVTQRCDATAGATGTSHRASARNKPSKRSNTLAEQWEQRLAIPVILAAAVSVPAVFLAIFGDGHAASLGTMLNWASLVVLTAETVVLFLLAGDRLTWLRRHWWIVIVTVVAVPAVILALGPVQVLRLVQFFGALRVLRAGRIVKAGRVIARRSGWTGLWRYAPILVGSLLAAVFVAIVLADRNSTTRQLLETYVGSGPMIGLVVLGGAILAVGTFIVLRNRNR